MEADKSYVGWEWKGMRSMGRWEYCGCQEEGEKFCGGGMQGKVEEEGYKEKWDVIQKFLLVPWHIIGQATVIVQLGPGASIEQLSTWVLLLGFYIFSQFWHTYNFSFEGRKYWINAIVSRTIPRINATRSATTIPWIAQMCLTSYFQEIMV